MRVCSHLYHPTYFIQVLNTNNKSNKKNKNVTVHLLYNVVYLIYLDRQKDRQID